MSMAFCVVPMTGKAQCISQPVDQAGAQGFCQRMAERGFLRDGDLRHEVTNFWKNYKTRSES